ncbi:MAG: YdcF family protein [Cyclobacteriaceae bacterium]
MFFILSKILLFVLDPVVWILILCVIACFKRYIWRKYVKWAIALLIIFTNPFLSNLAVKAVEKKPVKLESKYQVGILLCGMTFATPSPAADQMNFRASVDRFIETIRLYKQGTIEKILITGGSGSLVYQDIKESEQLASLALELGVDEHDLIIEADSKNTYENAVFTARLLKEYGVDQKSLLITSAFHMRRSESCFHKAGITFDSYPTDFMSTPVTFYYEDLAPNAYVLSDWKIILKEIVGILVYKLTGKA